MKKSFKIVILLSILMIVAFFVASCSSVDDKGGTLSGGKSVPLTADMISLNYNPDFTVYTGIPIVFDEYMYSISVNGTAANIRDFSFKRPASRKRRNTFYDSTGRKRGIFRRGRR